MIQAENELQAETWFFKIIVHLDYDRDFSDVLNACKKHFESCLSTVSVISWAASQKSESQHASQKSESQSTKFMVVSLVSGMKFLEWYQSSGVH